MKKLILVFLSLLSITAFAQEKVVYTSIDSIKDLSLVYNLDLSRKGLQNIPTKIFDLKNLKVLNLSDNYIRFIPNDIRKLKNLEVLRIDSNSIDNISKEILNLKELKNLSISDNVLGKQSALEAAIFLKSIGESNEAESLLAKAKNNLLIPLNQVAGESKPWEHTSYALGYVAANTTASRIFDASKITPDLTLKNNAVKISLDLVYVFDYPGSGRHKILITFSGKNQISEDSKEQVNYATTRTVQEGQFAGLRSIPIVVGLRVGKEGVEFNCATINVKNENDEKLMAILESDEANEGLKLLNTLNPVMPIISNLFSGIGKQFLSRNDNKKIEDFSMGLDFGNSSTKAKLAEGSYIVAQVANLAAFNWDDWIIKDTNGVIVSKNDSSKTLPFNYLVFSIAKTQ